MLIKSPVERQARAQEKRTALLRFLRDELYTTPDVAALVMNCGERAARQTVASMEQAGLVKRHPVKLMPQLPPLAIIGITYHGQALAFTPGSEAPAERVFEPSRFSLLTLSHTLDLQRLRIHSVNTGLVNQWLSAERLQVLQKGLKKPDAVILTAAGERIALEVERTLKSIKRYETVLAGHLQAIQQGKWQRVVWASPDEQTRERIEAIIKSFPRLRIAGVDTRITPAHHEKLAFCVYEMFTNHLERSNP